MKAARKLWLILVAALVISLCAPAAPAEDALSTAAEEAIQADFAEPEVQEQAGFEFGGEDSADSADDIPAALADEVPSEAAGEIPFETTDEIPSESTGETPSGAAAEPGIVIESAEPVAADASEAEEAAASDEDPEAPADVDSVTDAESNDAADTLEVSELTAPRTSLTLGMKESAALNVTALPEGAACALSYATSNRKIATVSEDGTVTAGKKKGSAIITVTSDTGHSLKIKITVKKAPNKVRLKVGARKLGVGQSTGYSYSLPKNTAGSCTASVDASGVLGIDPATRQVTALQPGTGVLTVRAYNGKRASVKIRVYPAPEYLVPSVASLETGVSFAEAFRVALPKGTLGAITYESLNPEIARYDPKKGRIVAVAVGETVVRGVAHNGAVGECAVRVRPLPEAIEIETDRVELLVGESYTPLARVLPDDAYGKLTLSTRNKKVVKVSGDTLRAVGKGTTTVTLKTCNRLTRTITVKVPAAPKSIVLDRHTVGIAEGETLSLGYKLGAGKTMVTFTTSSPGVADVDPVTGVVTGIGTGTAVITARTLNGLVDSCMVNVNIEAETSPAGDFSITFMDIGRNDGILICCEGEYAFIDSGMRSDGLTAVKYIRSRGITHLKYYIGTHAHRDHVGGAAPVISAFDVDLVMVPHSGVSRLIKKEARTSAEKSAVRRARYHTVKAGDTFGLGSARFKCVGPIRIRSASYLKTAENVNSLILNLSYGANSFLLTGDATGEELKEVEKKRPGQMRAQVLKNPHHNGRQDFAVKCCDPEIVVFSTSRGRQPTNSYVNWIRNRGAQVY